jgi:hypothetical protein
MVRRPADVASAELRSEVTMKYTKYTKSKNFDRSYVAAVYDRRFFGIGTQ